MDAVDVLDLRDRLSYSFLCRGVQFVNLVIDMRDR